MKFFAGCLCSAVLASLFTMALSDRSPQRIAVAQDPRPFQPSIVPAPPGGPRLPGPQIAPGADPVPLEPPALDMTPDEAVAVAVYERVNRAVVNVTARSVRAEGFFLLELQSEGTGSGVVIDAAGHVLTNYHVVEDAKEVSVTMYDGKSHDATLVGADPINDVAVLKIDAPRDVLFPVELGDSGRLKVGMRVFAIGNPFGLERTMTTGIISSLNRSLNVRGNRTVKSIIQIDAAVNPGNSGGPLLDVRGRLIGINTAIASKTGQSAGVGFAIPVNLVSRVVPQLIRHGRFIRPEIGIQRVYQTDRGLLIATLTPDGPADRAGLRGPGVTRQRRGPFTMERVDRSAADLIVAVNGEPTKSADDFLGEIERKNPGDQVVLTVVREDREIRVTVTLGGG